MKQDTFVSKCSFSIAIAFNNYFAGFCNRTTGDFTDFSDNIQNSIIFTLSDVKNALSVASLGTSIDLIPGAFQRFPADHLVFHVQKQFEGIRGSANYPEKKKKKEHLNYYTIKAEASV